MPSKASQTLNEYLQLGHMVLTEQGEWTRDNPSIAVIRLDELSAADALACSLADFTEAGLEWNKREIKRLSELLGLPMVKEDFRIPLRTYPRLRSKR